MSNERFWETTPLEALTEEQWEALCDGCGRCCLVKIEDQDSGELFYTHVICRFHDSQRGRCTHYGERSKRVPDCIKVTPRVAREEKWLPGTCAYRLLAEGEPLPDWHPLVSGDRDSVRRAGISVCGKVISERYIHREELVEHLVNWFD
jgi:uncharacterized cysteine cluster protein YcgN (CxxCxxCC family)